jgi:hypothetical protein
VLTRRLNVRPTTHVNDGSWPTTARYQQYPKALLRRCLRSATAPDKPKHSVSVKRTRSAPDHQCASRQVRHAPTIQGLNTRETASCPWTIFLLRFELTRRSIPHDVPAASLTQRQASTIASTARKTSALVVGQEMIEMCIPHIFFQAGPDTKQTPSV